MRKLPSTCSPGWALDVARKYYPQEKQIMGCYILCCHEPWQELYHVCKM